MDCPAHTRLVVQGLRCRATSHGCSAIPRMESTPPHPLCKLRQCTELVRYMRPPQYYAKARLSGRPWHATAIPTSSTWYGSGKAAPSRQHLLQGLVVSGGGRPIQARLTQGRGGCHAGVTAATAFFTNLHVTTNAISLPSSLLCRVGLPNHESNRDTYDFVCAVLHALLFASPYPHPKLKMSTPRGGRVFFSGGGGIEPSGRTPPPKKKGGSIDRTPKILQRLTPGPRR